VAFFACDRKAEGTVPVYEQPIDGGRHALSIGRPPQGDSDDRVEPLFHALPADRKEPPPATVPLYEFMHQDGATRAYSVDASWSAPGYRRAARPLCLVWQDPTRTTGVPDGDDERRRRGSAGE